MLHQPILDKLTSLKLAGMLEGLREQLESQQYRKLSFEERFGLLLDREWNLRQQRKQVRRMRVARFRERYRWEERLIKTTWQDLRSLTQYASLSWVTCRRFWAGFKFF